MIGELLAGRYLVLKQLGTGGFSETYLARDKYLPLHPLCVVKWLKPSADSLLSLESARKLFDVEARVLGQLGQSHGQIPALLAYCSEAEQTYLVQEYIEGENLGEWLLQGRRLTPAGAIELLLGVLPILDYIHSQGIIHRDIKPSNLLRRKGDGKIVLIDFGAACPAFSHESKQGLSNLAKHDAGDRSQEEALAIGTPGYMPDEQQAGRAEFSTDLYALGIAVIHLLTGVEPCQFETDLISGELNWQTYLHSSSQGNSQGSSQISSQISPKSGNLQKPTIDPALIHFLDRMVRSHCRDRFASAKEALSALNALGTSRKPRQSWTVMPRFRRSLALKPFLALLALGLAGGYLISSRMTVKSAEVQFTLLQEVSTPVNVQQMLISPNGRLLITADTDRVLRLWSLPDGKLLRSLAGHQKPITALYMSRNGRLLASSEGNTIRLWDTASGQLLQILQTPSHWVTALAISHDAERLVSGSQDGTVQVWQLETGIRMRTLKPTPSAAITAVTCGMMPNQIIVASSNLQLQVWNLQTGERDRVFTGHQEKIVGLQAIDRRTLLSFGNDRTLVWDLESGALMQAFSDKSAQPMTTSANHQQVVTVDQAGMLRIWTDQAGQYQWQASRLLEQSPEIAVNVDQHYLVNWQPNRKLQLWRFSYKK